MAFADRLVAAWFLPRLTPLTFALQPLGWLFGSLVAARRALYRRGWLASVRAGVPVVVIGNLTVGGSGKTPLAIALAQALAARGRHPGFVSRGYGGAEAGPREVQRHDDPGRVGDEPLLLATTGFPTWIGRDRAAAARALVAAHPQCDVVIADDGLQHYRLARDVEIAVVDVHRGFGNARLLPAGPLREPLSRLADVDAVVRLADRPAAAYEDATGSETMMTHELVRIRNLVDPARIVDPTDWPDGTVHAVAAIGHPQRFFAFIERLGIRAIGHAFPDHHRFVPGDFDFPGASAILMTAKDAVKCARFADARLHAVDIHAAIDPALVTLVADSLDGRQAP